MGDRSLSREALIEKLRARAQRIGEAYTEEELVALQLDPATLEGGIEQATTRWFRSLIREDPAAYLREIRVPVLALFGEKDLQVAAEVNARGVEAALAEAGNQDHEVRILPGLNHLFQHAESGAIGEYGEIEETIAPDVLERISGWIEERFAEDRHRTGS